MEMEEPVSENAIEIVNMNDIPVKERLPDVEADKTTEDENTETTLMYTRHTRIEVKDIYAEIRALRDVERFLECPTFLLNVHDTSLEDIMDVMLKALITKNEGCGIDPATAREAFFTKDSVHHLSHVIQGTEKSEGSGWEETQCWLVAMAELSSVQQNYVAIARLRHATNLGRTLQGTHLAVLILSPRKTKMTKSSLETGRTFATLLSDIEVRQQMLAAENEEEFLNVLVEYKKSLASGEYQRKKKSAKKRALAARSSSFSYTGAASYRETQKEEVKEEPKMFSFGRGIKDDFLRRLPFYASDFVDSKTKSLFLLSLTLGVVFV